MKKDPAGVFNIGDLVVYPKHGVCRIEAIEDRDLYGQTVQLFVMSLSPERMTLMVPTERAKSAGLRPLSDPALAESAIRLLSGRSRSKRGIWSRRAQEYEKKIRSGDLLQAAEVVRDLRGGKDDQGGSYSEKQLYEQALARVTREIAAVLRTEEEDIRARIESAQASRAA
jgi:CarD family transcriptional regulator